MTPTHISILLNNPVITKYLIDQGAKLDALNGNGNTPLHFAMQCGNKDMAKLLIKKYVEKNMALRTNR